MANLTRLLSRRPRIDEAEVEDVRERTMARLAGLGGEARTTNEAAAADAVARDAVEAVGPAAEVVAPPIEAPATPIEAPKPSGPKVIVPRTIALGPAPTAPTEAAAHRTPPIIVTGEPEMADRPAVGAMTDTATTADVVEPVVEPVVEREPTMLVVEALVVEVVDEPVSVIALPPPVAQEPEPIEITAEVKAAVEVIEVEAGQTVVDGATEPDVAVEASVVDAIAEPIADETTVEPEVTPRSAEVEAVVVAAATRRTSTPKANTAPAAKPAPIKTKAAAKAAPNKTKAPTTKSKAAKPPATETRTEAKAKSAAAKAKAPTTPSPAKRPPEAVPVRAQPTPVIDPGAVWPGKWLRDVSPDAPVIDLSGDAAQSAPRPVVVRRDPSLPVPRVSVIADDWDGQVSEVAAVKETAGTAVAVAEPVAAVAEPVVADVTGPIVAEAVAEPIVAAVVVTRPAKPTAPTRKAQVATPRKPRPTPPPRAKAQSTPPVSHAVTTVAAFCPYCALALEPPPTASRRCTRCRQRIVVKRVQGRVVYLTEAAVEVFDSERIRSANFGRWSKERAQWLKLATSVGADAGRIARLGDAPLSEKVVESSRTLYLSTTERSYREARRDDRWEDASRYKRDQAAAMHRLSGSPAPPTPEVIALHREAAAAELRGIGKMARDAELVGSRCCSTCSADDGRAFKIVTELKSPRLPHGGCPKGLCHCRWEFALRDATMVRRYLKRTRGKPKSPSA